MLAIDIAGLLDPGTVDAVLLPSEDLPQGAT
jgi:hypothetical protein